MTPIVRTRFLKSSRRLNFVACASSLAAWPAWRVSRPRGSAISCGRSNEFTTNAVVHGGGRGRITISTTATGVRVAVTDWGPGLPGPIADVGPTLNAPGGRGLWLARRLYPEMTVTSSPAGTTVTVHALR